jgi:hypothetical protein
MRVSSVQILNIESNVQEDLTAPDSVTFRVLGADGSTVTEIAGNQEGSTNAWNADHTFTTDGTYWWQAEIVEGTSHGICLRQRVAVEARIADVA